MRRVTLLLVILAAALQWPLWFGKGSLFRVVQLERQLTSQNENAQRLRMRNYALMAEVEDLKTGHDALEERARVELGMIQQGEIFFQILDAPTSNTVSLPMDVEY